MKRVNDTRLKVEVITFKIPVPFIKIHLLNDIIKTNAMLVVYFCRLHNECLYIYIYSLIDEFFSTCFCIIEKHFRFDYNNTRKNLKNESRDRNRATGNRNCTM